MKWKMDEMKNGILEYHFFLLFHVYWDMFFFFTKKKSVIEDITYL